MTIWALQDIVKRFDGAGWFRDNHSHVALDGVSIDVRAAERVGIIGESGSGKTTLARVGLGLVRATGGTVELFGEDTRGWSTRRWRVARHDAQMLFQNPKAMLNPAMTLGQLLRESARLHDGDRDPERAALEILERVGLEGRERSFPFELSGGERRRAGIARLLLARPRLVVADEPAAGLDAALKADLVELLFDRVGNDCAVVLISHDVALVLWCCTRILVMRQGRVVDRFLTADLGQVEHHAHTLELLRAAEIGTSPVDTTARGSA
ncbi:MAG: ABC transporter ATP-binding protein [Deltaproteobacteria bacterium]|nr:ABC transporter ATP-binding protein [Deltaproteobacteria bacterium]